MLVCDMFDGSKRAVSQGNLLRGHGAVLPGDHPDHPGGNIPFVSGIPGTTDGRVGRRAVSACSLARKPQKGHGGSAQQQGHDTNGMLLLSLPYFYYHYYYTAAVVCVSSVNFSPAALLTDVMNSKT